MIGMEMGEQNRVYPVEGKVPDTPCVRWSRPDIDDEDVLAGHDHCAFCGAQEVRRRRRRTTRQDQGIFDLRNG